MKAADDAALFKFIVRGVARKHGLGATFMAKPYGEDVGSGFHLHVSMLDAEGGNVFDDGSEWGGDTLRAAVAGLLSSMAESTLLFAPHLNSFRRLRDGTHAPTMAAWGHDNRTAAVRIPASPGVARRFEHRVAGADANPYLVLTAVLAAALEGIKAKAQPPAPFTGSSYEQDLPRLPTSWTDALLVFQNSDFVERTFGAKHSVGPLWQRRSRKSTPLPRRFRPSKSRPIAARSERRRRAAKAGLHRLRPHLCHCFDRHCLNYSQRWQKRGRSTGRTGKCCQLKRQDREFQVAVSSLETLAPPKPVGAARKAEGTLGRGSASLSVAAGAAGRSYL